MMTPAEHASALMALAPPERAAYLAALSPSQRSHVADVAEHASDAAEAHLRTLHMLRDDTAERIRQVELRAMHAAAVWREARLAARVGRSMSDAEALDVLGLTPLPESGAEA